MILSQATWLFEKSLKLYKPESPGSEYTAYILFCWLSSLQNVPIHLCLPVDIFVEHVQREAGSSAKFLHQVVFVSPVINLKSSVSGRVCVSEWYLQAVRVYAMLWTTGGLLEKLSNLPKLMVVPFALHERCIAFGWYCRPATSTPPVIRLESFIQTNIIRTVMGKLWSRQGIIFECNIAFLLQATMGFCQEVCPSASTDIYHSYSGRDGQVRPRIRARYSLDIRTAMNLPSFQDLHESKFYVKRLDESASDAICAVLRSGKPPHSVSHDGSMLWEMTDQEWAGVDNGFQELARTTDEVPSEDWMCELGIIEPGDPRVVR